VSLRLIKHFFAITGGQLLNLVSQILLAPLFLRHWSVSIYGAWMVLSGLTTYLGTLDLGMNSAVGNRLLASYVRKDHAEYQRCQHSAMAFYLVLALGASIVVGAAFWLLPVQSWAGVKRSIVPDAPWILWLLALQVLWMMPVGLLGNFYTTVGDPARSKWINNWRSAGVLVVTVLGLMLGCGMKTLAVLQLLPMIPVALYVLWDIYRRYPGYLPSVAHADKSVVREILKPSLMFAVIALAFSLTQQGTLLITSSIFGLTAAAILVPARTLTSLALQSFRIISTTAWPDMTMLYARKELGRLRLLNQLVVTSSVTLCIAIAAALWSEGVEVMNVWLHHKIRVDPLFLRLLLVYVVLETPWIANSTVTAAVNRHHNQAWSYLVSGIIALGSMLLLSPRLGMNAVPVALILGEAVACYHFVIKDTCKVLEQAYLPYMSRLWFGVLFVGTLALGSGWLVHQIAWGPALMRWSEVGSVTLVASCLGARLVWIGDEEWSLLRQKAEMVLLRLRPRRLSASAIVK